MVGKADASEATTGSAGPSGPEGPVGQLVARTFKSADSALETTLNFLVIDSPEKWKPATSFSNKLTLTVGKTRLSMPIRPLSYLQWESVELSFPMPSRMQSESAQDFEVRTNHVKNLRRVTVIELSTGKQIPGKSMDDKIAWVSRLGTGEMQSVFVNILDNYSGVSEGELIAGYRDTIEAGDMQECVAVELDTMEDWMSASQVGSTYRTQRSFENYIIEFPLRQITDEAKARIDQSCKEPLPPGKPGLDPRTQLPSQAHMQYDWEEPRYLEALRATNRLKTVLLFEAVLPFPIPGSKNEEKFEWLGARLMGDVHKLRTHIENNLLNYQSRLHFFSNAYAPQS